VEPERQKASRYQITNVPPGSQDAETVNMFSSHVIRNGFAAPSPAIAAFMHDSTEASVQMRTVNIVIMNGL